MTPVHRAVDAAGSWAHALIRTAPATVQPDRMVLSGIGIAAPVAVGLLLSPHDPAALGAGSLASMGALMTSVMDVGAAGSQRVRRMTLAATLATAGFALGTAAYGDPVLTLVVVVLAAAASAAIGAMGTMAAKASVGFLMFTATAANATFGLHEPWLAPLLFGCGALWRLLLTGVAAAIAGRAFRPERRVVARVYRALADQFDDPVARTGARVTATLNDAYDTLAAARTRAAAHDPRCQQLVLLLNASAPVVDVGIAVSQGAAPPGRTVPDAAQFLREVADRIEDPSCAAPTPPDGADADPLTAGLRAVALTVCGAPRVATADDLWLPVAPSFPARLRAAARAFAPGTERWSGLLRLVLCMAVAQGLCVVASLDHPYLVVLTVAQVMQPGSASVFARAVQRAVGTLGGVVLGSIAMELVPRGWWQVAVILLLAASIPAVMPRNYGLYAMVTTPIAVLLVELHAGPGAGIVDARLFETLAGCAIVLLLGFACWPATWHAPRRFAVQVADLVRAVGAYGEVVLADPDDTRRATMRHRVYRQISDLRTRIAQSMAEPPAISSAMAAWLPAIAALDRLTDAVTVAATDVPDTAPSGPAMPAADVAASWPTDGTSPADGGAAEERAARFTEALEELAGDVESGRVPDAVPDGPDCPSAVWDGVEAARAAFAARPQHAARRRPPVSRRGGSGEPRAPQG
ncbi:FUSC family protein [Microbacterium sp. KSW4-16]|uniref:FUSC family protein n=1 Tax=Microbacterium aurugineum TaxID=2851642 RepID=UPI0020BEC7BB|nr:FUSC family protein [Microbacterium aurugineum]MCK8468768.1 FUSC family protein [Microbacterium aurugineum]